jgi:hypothetical protein
LVGGEKGEGERRAMEGEIRMMRRKRCRNKKKKDGKDKRTWKMMTRRRSWRHRRKG